MLKFILSPNVCPPSIEVPDINNLILCYCIVSPPCNTDIAIECHNWYFSLICSRINECIWLLQMHWAYIKCHKKYHRNPTYDYCFYCISRLCFIIFTPYILAIFKDLFYRWWVFLGKDTERYEKRKKTRKEYRNTLTFYNYNQKICRFWFCYKRNNIAVKNQHQNKKMYVNYNLFIGMWWWWNLLMVVVVLLVLRHL